MSFMRDGDTGHLVGIEQRPYAATVRQDWPKWVVPHESQIVRTKAEGMPDQVSTPGFADFHVNRADGVVTVLVANEAEEQRAAGEYQAPELDEYAQVDEETKREVRAEVERFMREQAEAIAQHAAIDREKLIMEESLRRSAEKRDRAERDREAAENAARETADKIAAADPAIMAAPVAPAEAIKPQLPAEPAAAPPVMAPVTEIHEENV